MTENEKNTLKNPDIIFVMWKEWSLRLSNVFDEKDYVKIKTMAGNVKEAIGGRATMSQQPTLLLTLLYDTIQIKKSIF